MSIKLIVMGVGGVGKSAITNRFVIGRWIEKVICDLQINLKLNKIKYVALFLSYFFVYFRSQYDPTIEESYQTTMV